MTNKSILHCAVVTYFVAWVPSLDFPHYREITEQKTPGPRSTTPTLQGSSIAYLTPCLHRGALSAIASVQ